MTRQVAGAIQPAAGEPTRRHVAWNLRFGSNHIEHGVVHGLLGEGRGPLEVALGQRAVARHVEGVQDLGPGSRVVGLQPREQIGA